MSVPSDKTTIINWPSYEKWANQRREQKISTWKIEDREEVQRASGIPLFSLEPDIVENVYKIGLILTDRETQETQILTHEESKKYFDLLRMFEEACIDGSEQVLELMDELRRIDEKYYSYPYIVEPSDFQKKMLATYGSFWTERDWFPIIGNNQDPSYESDYYLTTKGGKPKKPAYGNLSDMAYAFDPEIDKNVSTLRLFAAHRNSESEIKVQHKSRPILPAHMWGDASKGKWVDIDEATGWGELGNRKHPKNIKRKEQADAWNKWTSQKLQEKCVTPEGNIILFWTQGKSWNAKTKTFDKGYWSQTAFIDMKSLRPMLPLQQIVQCKFDKIDYYYTNSGEYANSKNKIRGRISLEMADKYRDMYVENDVESFSDYGDQYVRMGFCSSWVEDAEIDYEEQVFTSSIRVKMKYDTQQEQYACDMFANGDQRNAQMKVWLPDKPMNFFLYSMGIINCI